MYFLKTLEFPSSFPPILPPTTRVSINIDLNKINHKQIKSGSDLIIIHPCMFLLKIIPLILLTTEKKHIDYFSIIPYSWKSKYIFLLIFILLYVQE